MNVIIQTSVGEIRLGHQDLDPPTIIYLLRTRGMSLNQLAQKHDLARSTMSKALRVANVHNRDVERHIANAIGLAPELVWPSRFQVSGTQSNAAA